MFIDLHCNSTQTRHRLRGRESTQIQCHERVLYASASRPAAVTRAQVFPRRDVHGFLTSYASRPTVHGRREKEAEILLYRDQDSVWPRRGMNKR
ncbi:hypothetical protein MtrunA17_Chr5g0422061 [Medicago truncatula]|uniref:Uncharacterized protein n=1 Tax=Medicago truncatula TaxID=3880 RepID=A0A396HYJ3_MEDTR|nr:hypothetical protein MtrunA17_Chr5g0422061 [Medicago truncatula]